MKSTDEPTPQKAQPRIQKLLSLVLIHVVVLSPVSAGTNVWTRLGPDDATVAALAIDPGSPGIVYAATSAGLFKSVDDGASWSALKPGPPCCILTLLIDPETPSTLYAVTRVGGLSLDRRVLKSTDEGTNWSAVNSGLPTDADGHYGVSSLAVDPMNPNTIYAGNSLPGGGVFKSADGGESWNAVNSGLPDGGVIALAVDPQNTDTIYASAWTPGVVPNSTSGMYQSTDGGGSWHAVNSGLGLDVTRGYSYISALAIDPQEPATIYAAGSDGGLYKTMDAGTSWSVLSTIQAGLTGDTVFTLAIDPQNAGTVYAGTSAGVFKTTNGGARWIASRTRQVNETYGPLVIPALAIDPRTPDTIYAAATNAGVFKTTDAGANWTIVNSDLKVNTPASALTLGIDPQNPGTMYAGTDVGLLKTTDAGSNWSAVNAGLPGDANGHAIISALAIDPQTTNVLYAMLTPSTADEGICLSCGEIFKSTDGGASWASPLPLDSAGLVVRGARLYTFAGALAIDPRNPRTIYVGGTYSYAGQQSAQNGVLKSMDGGANWSPVSTGLPVAPNNQGVAVTVTTLAIDQQNPGTIYAGTDTASPFGAGSKVFTTTNGGGVWTYAGLTGYARVESLSIDPQNAGTVYGRIRSISPDRRSSNVWLFKTTNAGVSWSAVNSGLPNDAAALVVDPQNPSTLYTGNGSGVFRSIDGGTSWTAVNSGLTSLYVTSLAIDPNNHNTVYAGTAGGVFAITFAP